MSETNTPTPPQRGPGTKQLIVVVAVLAIGMGLAALTSDVTRVSEPGIRVVDGQPFLPATAGKWTGGPQSGLTETERGVLPADTQLQRCTYTDPDGRRITCAVVLAGRDVTSIHRPEVCVTGQGWQLDPATVERIEIAGAPQGVLQVSRMNGTHAKELPNGKKVKFYGVFIYWFVGKDRVTPHHWQRILWSTMDRVLHNRNHRWAYFLVDSVALPESTDTNPKAAEDEAMQQLRRFVRDIYPQLMGES